MLNKKNGKKKNSNIIIKKLQAYVNSDEIYQKYKNKQLKEISDFDRFCIKHCDDIEELIREYECLYMFYKDKQRNSSHINVGSIEEDIEILNSIVKVNKDFLSDIENQTINQKEIKALEHLLSDYTRQKQINEEHQKINGELREKVKELEEERQLVGIPVRNKRNGTIGIVLHQWKSGSIAVLENINPRVINTHDSWSTLEIITDEIKQTKTKDDSIAKQKIKDKIDEIIEDKDSKYYYEFLEFRDIQKTIDILSELLKEEEK